jgi:Ca-activated chloride channel family protein
MFGEAQSADPSSVEPQFNLGVVQLKKGDARSAINSFEKAARGAGMEGNAGLSARSLYNLGSAYESDKQDGGALRSFAAAVRMAELANDEALATEARKRIQKIQEQQQTQQKQQQNQKGQQSESQKGGQSGDQEKQQPSDGTQEKNEEKQPQNARQYEDPAVSRRREFKSDKMSPEDSERVMAELSAREKQLQAKLKKQRGARQANNDKDW